MALFRTFLLFLYCSPMWAALPVIVSFTASSQTVSSGSSIVLNCSVAGAATDIEVDDGAGAFAATNSSCGSGISKGPTSTTLYKLVAGNNSGSDGQAWAYQRVFVGTGNLAASVTNCSGATQNSTSCVITVSVGGAYANRYTDVVCDVSFTAPSTARIRRTSYWDPLAGVWKISLRPTEAGAYSWSGFCGANPSSGPSNYTAVSGSFNSLASNASGFLALYGGAAPYRLKTAGDGKPFYPVGIQQGYGYNPTTISSFFIPMTQGGNGTDEGPGTIPGDTNVFGSPDQYFGTYRAAGTNIFRNNGESTSGIFAGQYCDGQGRNNFDHDLIVTLDNLAAKADFYGIKLEMVPYYDPGPAILPGYDFFANLKTSSCFLNLWLEYFARYGDQTSIWELGNEIVPGVQYVKTLVAFIHSQDPYNHLITLPSTPGNNVGLDITSPHYYFADTINPAATQTLDDTMVAGLINPMKSAFPNHPIIFGEIGDACPVPDADPPVNERWRDMLWTAFFNQAGVIAWNSFHGDGRGCGGGLSNLFVGVTQRAQQLVFSNWISDFDPLATPASVTLGNLGGDTARVYALAGSASVGAYITHVNNHSSVVTGATATLNVPASGLVATWMNPFDGTILGTSTPGAGSQTLTIPAFSQDIVLKISATSSSNGGQSFSESGGNGVINLTLPAGFSWTAVSTAGWINLTGVVAGSGSGTISYQVASNSGPARSGSISVAGLTYTVIQQAASIPGLNFIGSMAHIAAEENWTTTFTLVNKSASPVQARLNLYGDPSGALTLPLGFPQQPANTGPILAASLDEALAAHASLIINTAGPQTPPVQIGSAQIAATGPVDGFAIFHHVVTAQETVVPLETRNASSYTLAFDNTSGIVMGVAVANVSAQNAVIPVVIRDDAGTVIGAPGASISLGGNGHLAFVLSDAAAGFPVTAAKRGTIEFYTPAGGQISVLGIRFTPPNNALTTIPALANVGTGGGSIAHFASGGDGWKTTFVLVNAGSTAALANLSFFADSTGNPISLPLSFPQSGSGTAATVPAVAQTLSAGATLIVESSASANLLTGSAQLSSNGNVRGFAIFRHNDQEAAVPFEDRNAGGYILAFDNTNGTATGIAINSVSSQPVNVQVVVRDDTGIQIVPTDVISLAANGHYAFTLGSDRYPVTAGIRGTIEFVGPSAGQIGVLALRIPLAHTFTSLPAMAE